MKTFDLLDSNIDPRERLRCWMTIATGVLVELTDLSPEDRNSLRTKGADAIEGLSDEAAEEMLWSLEGYITAPWESRTLASDHTMQKRPNNDDP